MQFQLYHNMFELFQMNHRGIKLDRIKFGNEMCFCASFRRSNGDAVVSGASTRNALISIQKMIFEAILPFSSVEIVKRIYEMSFSNGSKETRVSVPGFEIMHFNYKIFAIYLKRLIYELNLAFN